jgi:hypothetical protein
VAKEIVEMDNEKKIKARDGKALTEDFSDVHIRHSASELFTRKRSADASF